MLKLRAIILLLILFTAQVVAQNTVHLCVGETHNFAVPYTIGSNYDWRMQGTQIGAIISGSATDQIIMELNSTGTFKLIVEELDSNGCTGFDTIQVEIHEKPIPIISALGPLQFCAGIDLILQVNSEFESYVWSDGSSVSELRVVNTGNYSVIVTNEFGCINESNTISVVVQSDLYADFNFEGTCVNSPTYFFNNSFLSGDVINSISWDLGNGIQSFSDSISHSYKNLGDYQVSLFIETLSGCKDSVIKTVTIFGNPIASFNYNPYTISTLNPDINFINSSVNATPYLWDFGDSVYSYIANPSHIYDAPGIYDVMLIVKDVNECMDSITKHITMYYDFALHVPTAFTPNNDGDNDEFGPQGLRMKYYQSYGFFIYNEWGEIIFETDNINEFWDGADSQHGSYAWIIIIVDELGALRKEAGEVLLIK